MSPLHLSPDTFIPGETFSPSHTLIINLYYVVLLWICCFVFGLNVALISPTKAASLDLHGIFFFAQVLNVKHQLVTNQRVECLAFFGIPEIWLPKGQSRKQMTPWTPIDCLVPTLASYTEKMEWHPNCIWLNQRFSLHVFIKIKLKIHKRNYCSNSQQLMYCHE